MCSTFKFKNCMGRNFDYEISYQEELRIISPMEYSNELKIIGMCTGLVKYPLLYDGMNSEGLTVSALSFPGNAVYNSEDENKINIPAFDFVFQILSSFKSVQEVINFLESNDVNITNKQFSKEFPNTDLHWFVSDTLKSIIIEQTKKGLNWYDGEVMTNNPKYPSQKEDCEYLNNLIGDYPMEVYEFLPEWNTRGLETYGLDGAYTSDGRFQRLTYIKEKLESSEDNFNSISQGFHLLSSVEQVYGLTPVNKKYEYTIYSIIYDMQSKKVYLKFYDELNLIEESL